MDSAGRVCLLAFQPNRGLFLISAFIAVYGVLKFIGCLSPCYNCKRCTRGFGRMAALYFGKRNLKDYRETYGLAPALFFYAFIGPFPAAFSLALIIQRFTVLGGLVSLVRVALTVYSGLTWVSRKSTISN